MVQVLTWDGASLGSDRALERPGARTGDGSAAPCPTPHPVLVDQSELYLHDISQPTVWALQPKQGPFWVLSLTSWSELLLSEPFPSGCLQAGDQD